MASVDMSQVLADIAAGRVTADQHDMFAIPDTAADGTEEAYRLLIVDAVTRAWVMRPAPLTQPGAVPMVLTSLGEHVVDLYNPARYQSRRAFAAFDLNERPQASRVVFR